MESRIARIFLLFSKKIRGILGSIKFQESIFALPFAYLGMFLAADGFPGWSVFIWITVCMVSARALGMSVNRIVDRHIDALNPRTFARHLPSGSLMSSDLIIFSLFATTVFIIGAYQLNLLAIILAPVAVTYLILYPFTKRFTWGSSFFLGCALGIAPSAAWIGVLGKISWEPILLSAAVTFWATSFDILYHIQDRDFYISQGLFSVSQKFGVRFSFGIAAILDVLAVACLILLGWYMELSYHYFAGCILASALLVYKYFIVRPSKLQKLSLAFYRINAYVSTIMFGATLIAVLSS